MIRAVAGPTITAMSAGSAGTDAVTLIGTWRHA